MELNLDKDDLYDILGVEHTCSITEIKKAYRKLALQCHPDKNPNNPNAAKEFHRLSKILEILADEAARGAYDKVLKGRKEAELRHKQLDSKRQKLKEDLEAREKAAASGVFKSPEQLLQEEIERLRKEGSRQVEEEMAYVLSQLAEELSSKQQSGSHCRIKIKWNYSKGEVDVYSYDKLYGILSKHGDIEALVLSKKGSAIVEFKTQAAAEAAMSYELGLMGHPLTLTWLNGPPKGCNKFGTLLKDTDFESLTLMKLRQAEERKRLIEQIQAEEENT